jgi:xylulokinase
MAKAAAQGMNSELVAGIDSSTQSVKVVIRNARTGELIREGRAAHPDGTEVDPEHWWNALNAAIERAGGLDDVGAVSVAGQQHGMVALDHNGKVIRPALLWNDTRSAQEALTLNEEAGGNEAIARATGSVLVASFTASKVRWLVDHEPENAAQVAAICLPHDWLSWRLSHSYRNRDLSALFTDRSEASGTGYFNPVDSTYDRDLLALALRSSRKIITPHVIAPHSIAGNMESGIILAPGAGDNAAAALGVGARVGDVIISLGTSGTAFAVSDSPTHDPLGEVAGFADATGRYLPLVCTLNAARIVDSAAAILGVDHERVAELALSARPGADGLSLLPYFEGERTPNRPHARGTLDGLSLRNSTRENIARAMLEGMICGLTDAVQSLLHHDVEMKRILLIGGAAKNPAVAQIASAILGREILLPPTREYVADGAALQAAWVLLGEKPEWNLGAARQIQTEPAPEVLERYRRLRDRTESWDK